MACEAPCDLGCVIAADTLLSFGSSFDARKGDVEEIERVLHYRLAIEGILIQDISFAYAYCRFLEALSIEVAPRALIHGRSMLKRGVKGCKQVCLPTIY